MKATKEAIRSFLEPKTFAIAGVSRDMNKFSYKAFVDMKTKGFTVFPVNPSTDEIQGEKCYRNVGELPSGVTHLVVMTPKMQTQSVVEEAVSKGIRNIWIQQMSETPEAIEAGKAEGINLVTNTCILMHAEPVSGFHKFHRNLLKFFGRLPR